MNVLILSSASTNIDPYYVSVARNIANSLACDGHDLVFGGASSSMMGVCYQEFINKGRNVYAFTTEKYIDDLKELKDAKHYIRETTFDMKKDMFENSDFIVVLPGGLGTLSELLSYIEENRSNDKNVPIEIFDEKGYYDNLFDMLAVMNSNGFIDDESLNMIGISHNRDEFIQHINNYVYGKRGK